MIWCRFEDARPGKGNTAVYGLVEDGVVTTVTGDPFGGYEKTDRRIPVDEIGRAHV